MSVLTLAALGCLIMFGVILAGGCNSNSPVTLTSIQSDELSGLLAASEMVVGENRFPFGVMDVSGRLIPDAEVHVSFYKLNNDQEVLKSEADAVFYNISGSTPHRHPDGEIHMHEEVLPVYTVASAIFDEPGIWRASLQIRLPNDSTQYQGSLAFQVEEVSATLQVNDEVPPSRNPTGRDVEYLSMITTHNPPIPGFYQLTVEEALVQGKPFVVMFSTPAFCLTRMCGPVTDVTAQVYDTYKGRINFIHIEPWDLILARNEGRLEWTDISREWNLPSEPWLFVVDSAGYVHARFEGLVSPEELLRALDGVLVDGS